MAVDQKIKFLFVLYNNLKIWYLNQKCVNLGCRKATIFVVYAKFIPVKLNDFTVYLFEHQSRLDTDFSGNTDDESDKEDPAGNHLLPIIKLDVLTD